MKFKSLLGVIEALTIFILVIGGLYFGVFTPTEAGAAGVLITLVVSFSKLRLNIAMETLGIGTRIAFPVNLPSSAGSALATALAAPVLVRTIFNGPLRPRRSCL